MADIAFAIQSYRSDSLPVSAQRLVNGYCEVQPQGAKAQVPVFGFPGIGTFARVGEGPIRGMLELAGSVYAVSGDQFFTVDEDGNATIVGSGITGNAPVSMDASGTQIVIVNGTENGWCYTIASNSFAQIADADFNGAHTVTFLDSYFLFDWLNTNKFVHSDLLDGLSYDALAYASAESAPDNVKSVINDQGRLIVFGERTLEPWGHTGAVSFPFQRWQGQIPKRGIGAPLARVIEDNSTFFFGDDRIFYRLSGVQPIRVSTHAIEKEWETYATVSDAFCFVVPWGGHKFVYITFPTEGKTWGYDVATRLWHERISWDPSGAEVKWRVNCALTAYSKVLIGDASSNRIGFLDPDVHTEFSDPVRLIATSAPVHGKGRMGFMPMIEIDMETGVGTATGQGADPQAMLDWSDDGGHTYSAPQLWQSMGEIGEYQTRLQWDRLGSFYQRVLRLQITDPVKRRIIAARAPGLYFEDR